MLSVIVMIIAIFIISRVMRDAKIFTKLIVSMAISLIVGFGIKLAVNSAFTTNIDSKTIINNTTVPMHSVSSPFVTEEDTIAIPDSASKEDISVRSDSIIDNRIGYNTNTTNFKVSYLDDS